MKTGACSIGSTGIEATDDDGMTRPYFMYVIVTSSLFAIIIFSRRWFNQAIEWFRKIERVDDNSIGIWAIFFRGYTSWHEYDDILTAFGICEEVCSHIPVSCEGLKRIRYKDKFEMFGMQLFTPDTPCCAYCGITESKAKDDITLRTCTTCQLVQYCGVTCEVKHWPHHKRQCQIRATDRVLFQQPEGIHLGECPLCFIPLPIEYDPITEATIYSCCSTRICNGCDYANDLRIAEEGLDETCPFCREPVPDEEGVAKNDMKRVKVNDPVATLQVAKHHLRLGDHVRALKYFTKAAELGEAEAHFNLGWMYEAGERGVKKDRNKAVHHYAEAAICGHPRARYNLGNIEQRRNYYERAAKHFIIAAKQGHDVALEKVKRIFTRFKEEEFVSKDEYAAALRAHQASIDATKSELRKIAAEAAQKEAAKAS